MLDIMDNLVPPKNTDSYIHSELLVDDNFVADFNLIDTFGKKKKRIKSFLLEANQGTASPFDLSCIDFKIFSRYLA